MKINGLSNITDEILLRRLNEIDDELKDWHISAYRSELLIEETNFITSELQRRKDKSLSTI